MSDLLKRQQPVAKINRTGFDLGQMTKFTSTVGQLLPVYYDFLYPNDEVELSFELFTRMQPLQTDAMVGITEHVDLFFVPAVQILSYFEDWVTNVKDLNSSILDFAQQGIDKDSLRLPMISNATLLSFLMKTNGLVVGSDSVADLGSTVYSGLTGNTLDMYGVPRYYNLYRLLDLLGQGSTMTNIETDSNAWLSSSSGVISGVNNIYLMFFAAYQKIFYDYYSLEDRTARNTLAFNLDGFWSSQSSQFTVDSVYNELTALRYRPWKTDFFTCVQNSPYYSGSADPNSYGRSLSYLQNWLGGRGDCRADLSLGRGRVPDGLCPAYEVCL